MSISMRDCLKLSSFQNCEILSGETELDNRVCNISVLEIANKDQADNVACKISSDEIYLSSFEKISEDIETQCKIIEHLSEKNNVGLVLICKGMLFNELHPYVVSRARELTLPLIVIPAEKNNFQYCHIINQVFTLIIEKQNNRNKTYRQIAAILSKVPEKKRNFSELLGLISENKQVNLILADVYGLSAIQSFCSGSDSPDLFYVINMFNREDKNISENMITAEFEKRKRNFFHVKLSSHKLRHYSLYIEDETRKLNFNDTREIAELIQMFSEIWNLSEDEISSQSIINALYEGNNANLKTFSQRYHFNIDKPGQLFLIHINYENSDNYNTVQEKIKLQKRIKEAAENTKEYIFFNAYGEYLILFMREFRSETDAGNFITSVLTITGECKCSITKLHIPLCEVKEILNLYDGISDDMEKILPDKKLYTLPDLLFTSNCKLLSEGKGVDKIIIDSILKKIFSLSDSDDLLTTLCTFYLDTDCHINDTANLLYIHRQTVRYRLRKVQELLQETTYSQNNTFMKLLMGYYRLIN